MEEKEIKTVQTSRGELQYYRDWECDGAVRMLNPQTLDRYKEIREGHPNMDRMPCFWAFGQGQFNEALAEKKRAGLISDSDKIKYHPHYSGLYGTDEGISAFLSFYAKRDTAIPTDCDPQEVYFYEYNNHECMIDWDGDLSAIRIIIDIWGAAVAEKITRFSAGLSVADIVAKQK